MQGDSARENQRLETLLDGLALVSRVFWGPDPELCREVAGLPDSGLAAGLPPLLDETGAAALRALASYASGFGSAPALCEELEPAYVRLFISHPEGLAAPLYHSCYVGQGLIMGPPAGVMASRLEDAGLVLSGKEGEPPDHLSVELEYLIYLLEEARDDRPEFVERARDMAATFMLPWLTEFGQRLESEQQCPLFGLAARLLISILKQVAAQPA